MRGDGLESFRLFLAFRTFIRHPSKFTVQPMRIALLSSEVVPFAFFSRAALALIKHLDWQPDVVHGNDWPCGFAMMELRARRRYDEFFRGIKTLFSIHNLAYQGAFDPGDLWWLGFGESPDKDDFIFKGAASALKAGLIAADALSTVSRRYAEEIQKPEHGSGLDLLLRGRRDRLAGG